MRAYSMGRKTIICVPYCYILRLSIFDGPSGVMCPSLTARGSECPGAKVLLNRFVEKNDVESINSILVSLIC